MIASTAILPYKKTLKAGGGFKFRHCKSATQKYVNQIRLATTLASSIVQTVSRIVIICR